MSDLDVTAHPSRSGLPGRGRHRRHPARLVGTAMAVLALGSLGACTKAADVSVGAGAGTSSTVAPAANAGKAGAATATPGSLADAAERTPAVAPSCVAAGTDLPAPLPGGATEPGGMPTSSVPSAKPPVPPPPGQAPDSPGAPEITIMTQPPPAPGQAPMPGQAPAPQPMPAVSAVPADEPGALVDPAPPTTVVGAAGAPGANTATAVDGGPASTGMTTATAVPVPPDGTGTGGAVPECPDTVLPPHPTPGGCVEAPATTTPFDKGGGRIVCSDPATGGGSGSSPGSPGDPDGSVSSPPMTTVPGDPPLPGAPIRRSPDATHGVLNGSTGGSPCPRSAETCVAMYELVPATIAVLPAAGGAPVTTVESDGGFSVLLPPGTYTLQAKPTAGDRACADQTVTITAGRSADTSIDCALAG